MKRTTTGYATLLFLGGLGSACGGNQSKFDGGPDADPGQTPIVERPMVGSYACSVSRDHTSHAPLAWTGLSALQAVVDGSVFLARAEWDGTAAAYYSAHHSFVLSSLGLDGTLGSPTTIPVDNADTVAGLAMAPQGQGFVLVWLDAQAIRFAAFDAKGVLVGQPRLVTTLDHDASTRVAVQIAADISGAGFAMAVSAVRNNVPEPYALFLNADGDARGSMRRLGTPSNATNAYYEPAPYVTATANGYAFVWSDLDGTSGRILFTKTDALGSETVAPTVVTRVQSDKLSLGATGFVSGGTRIVEMAGGFVAAWSETYKGETVSGDYSPSQGAWSVVRLARLDSQGTPTGTTATMRAPENDVDEVEPVLTPFGNRLAVAWGRGSHIYVCGGCIPDQRIDFILIDPASFTPLSNVVTVTNGGNASGGGLLHKQVALTGSSFLALYDRTFHTSAEPGSAVFSCSP